LYLESAVAVFLRFGKLSPNAASYHSAIVTGVPGVFLDSHIDFIDLVLASSINILPSGSI
jgi:hypothetical protein